MSGPEDPSKYYPNPRIPSEDIPTVPSTDGIRSLTVFLSFLERNQSENVEDEEDFRKNDTQFVLAMIENGFTRGFGYGPWLDNEENWQYIRKPETILNLDLIGIQNIMTYFWRRYGKSCSSERFLRRKEERVALLHALKRLQVLTGTSPK